MHVLLRCQKRKWSGQEVWSVAVKVRRDATAARETLRNQGNRQGGAMKSTYTVDFSEIRMGDVALVGGKNASLGELFRALKPKGVGVFDLPCGPLFRFL